MENKELKSLVDKLEVNQSLAIEEYVALIDGYNSSIAQYAAEKAMQKKDQFYGNKVYIRGLIEISNICKNDCYYCGIRKSNASCERYRLTKEEIMNCCATVPAIALSLVWVAV